MDLARWREGERPGLSESMERGGWSQGISREADGKRYRLAQGLPRITIRYYCEMDKYDCAV